MTYTVALSNFIVNPRFEDFPPSVVEVARKCVFNWIGVTVGAGRATRSSTSEGRNEVGREVPQGGG